MTEEELHHKRYEEDRQHVANFRLMDDDFMKAVFAHSKAAAEKTLQIIMEMPDLVVDSVRIEDDLHNLFGHSVRLDVHVKDDTGTHYDVEIQRADKGAGERRARYNLGLLDSSLLARGEHYEQLPEAYIIFITERDFFGRGLPMYHVERMVSELKEPFDDGEHIIYVNGEYQGDNDIGKLMADFRTRSTDDIYFRELAEPIRYFKGTKEGVSSMCKVIETIRAEERAEGRVEGEINMLMLTVSSLMENMKIPALTAMDMLKVPEDRREEVLSRLPQ